MAKAMACYVIDKFDQDAESLLPDLEMRVQEQTVSDDDPHGYRQIDPSKYKDMFDDPPTFDDAWNSEPFQWTKSQEAINKEFSKMELNKVWTKVKRSSIPEGRCCVKHKWVLQIKRAGTFRPS